MCTNNIDSHLYCSFPEESLTAKFHVMIFEHQRMMQKYFMCGMTTEEFIEVLHRDENEHKRLVRHMHDAGVVSAFIPLSNSLCRVQQPVPSHFACLTGPLPFALIRCVVCTEKRMETQAKNQRNRQIAEERVAIQKR